MTIPTDIKKAIKEAEARALATAGPHGVNVVPVSVVDVTDDQVCLYNFFMGKTIENLKADPEVALCCWKGLIGIQIKARATYITSGSAYEAAVMTMKARFPERTLAGMITLMPTHIFDVSAGTEAGKVLV